MKEKQATWAIAIETWQALARIYREPLTKVTDETGIQNRWAPLNFVYTAEPEPFDLQKLHEAFPFGKIERQIETFENIAKDGFLEKVADQRYKLTEQGRETRKKVYGTVCESLKSVQQLPMDEIKELNGLLFRIVKNIQEAPGPVKWYFNNSRITDPGPNWGEVTLLDQYITDLYFFRDDAPSAAWMPYGVGGRTWEAFTFIWRGDVSTADELVEKLTVRGHTAEDYGQSLAELVELGWIESVEKGFQVSEKGRKLREEAEEKTDHTFYDPWDVLKPDEQIRANDLLGLLKTKIEEVIGTE
ncbi:MAG: hypothetical protein MUO76_13300 [Anaerolineaceae bacterium]|nr:hypothetical protein [Anaerolineaceae bacterium]